MIEIADILKFLNGKNIDYKFVGDENCKICGFSSISHYKPETMTWIKSIEYIPDEFSLSKCTLLVTSLDLKNAPMGILKTHDSKYVFFEIIENFFSKPIKLPSIGQNTYISEEVKIGKNVKIGHNCSINGDIEIGDNTIISNNVSMINKVRIGENCIIQSGVVIGHDGFGFTENDNYEKKMIKHYGGVEIRNNVFIGSNTEIARGTIDNTFIGEGSKIDALCHIAHNVIIKKNVSIVAGSLLYGSSQINDNVYIASGIIKNQKCINENAFVGMGAVVLDDVKEFDVVAGVPAKIIRNGRL